MNEQRKDEWAIPSVKTVKHGPIEYQLHDGFLFVDPDGNSDEGTWITDPTKSPDGRFDVDPEEFYGCDYLNWRDREQNARTTKRWSRITLKKLDGSGDTYKANSYS